MGDHDGRAAAHHRFVAVGHLPLGFRVERGARLVEDQNRRIREEGARHGDALALAGRQRHAALADHGRQPVGQAFDEPVQRRLMRRGGDLIVGGVRAGVADVFRDGRMEHARLLVDQRDVAPEIAEAHGAEIVTVDAHDAGVGVEQAQQQVGNRRFTAAAAADDRQHLPGANAERQVVQRRRAAIEREGDVLERDVAADRRQRDGRGRLLDLDRLVENLRDAAQRDAHGRQVRVHPHQRLQRRQEARLVGHERDERPDRDLAADHAQTAVDEDQPGPARKDQAGQSAGQIGQPLHRHQGADERGVPLAESPDFPFLRVRRHHQPDRLQRFDQEAADVGAALTQRRDLRFQPRAITGEQPQSDRRGRHRHQEQADVEPREHRDRAAQEEHVADPGQRGLRGDALDLADVVVDARHDVANAGAGMETGGQALQMAVHLQPHVEQDVGRHARVAQAADHVHDEARGGDRGEQHGDANQGREVAANQGAVEELA